MKKLGLSAFVFLIVFGVLGKADLSSGELSVQLEPMWMDVGGNKDMMRVGDVYRFRDYQRYDPPREIYAAVYGATYEPVNLDMGDGFAPRAEIWYRKGKRGLGITGWRFETGGSVSRRVTTPETLEYVSGVKIRERIMVPVRNDLEPSGMSPIDYWAGNNISVWTADIFYEEALTANKDNRLDIRIGLKFGDFDNEINEGVAQRVFVYHYFKPGSHLDRAVVWESKSKADHNLMAGPVIGLRGKFNGKGIGLEGLLTKSVLFGKVEQSSTQTYSHPLVFEIDLPLLREYNVTSPIIEAKLKFLFAITENASLALGGFGSFWGNVEIAPIAYPPTEWPPAGIGWLFADSGLVFFGALATLTVKV